jgi:hypothetical protein
MANQPNGLSTVFPLYTSGSFSAGELQGNGDNIFQGVNSNYYTVDKPRDGMDMFFFVQPLNHQMATLETNMQAIMNNANLSDVQKQFQLQQAVNSWSAIAQGMTAMIKTTADVCSSIAHNMNT